MISPTRELALQTSKVLHPLAEIHNFSYQTFIGGEKAIKKANIKSKCNNRDLLIILLL